MLKLDSLEISGFKSFLDPVEVIFHGGITAIVGPNGCGKSNLSDAITWVLGEQSAKSLRSSKMEDVIFNGSARRKPVGMAEVSLTFLADPSFADAIDGKIAIGRRVFRSGESQYRLNGKVVRLKQIKDLLMDTGLGIRAYSVIEQGKIGMILSGKPQERRKLLEEAAGITRYKARKRLAELKLEESTANLLRLDDIVSEVERALRSLKRQANAARRFQEKEGEYHGLLKQVLLGRWSLLSEQLGGLDRQLDELTARDADASARLHRGEASLASGREELDKLAAVLAERHQQQADLAAAIEGRQEFLKGSRQRSTEFDERLLKGRREAEERRRQSRDFQSSLGTLDDRTRQLIDERDEAARLVAEDDARIAAAQQAVEAAAARLESLRRELMESLARSNSLRSELQRCQVEIEKRGFRQRYLDEERQRLDGRLADSRATLSGIEEQVARDGAELEAKSERRQQVADALESLLRREAEHSDEQRNLESELAALEQRHRILAQLSEEHADRRRALAERLAEVGIASPRFLAQEVTPVEGWEAGIDHFLGELADAVLLGAGDDALALAHELAAAGGSGIFLRPLAAGAPAPEVDDPAVSRPLTEALGLPDELARALPPAWLVESDEDAARLAAAHPGAAFISRGRLWALGGSLHLQSQEAAPGVLARQSELEAITATVPVTEKRLRQTVAALETLVAERTRHAAERNRLDGEIGTLQREIAVGQARRQDAQGRMEKLEAERGTVVTEQEEIAGELASMSADQERLAADLAEAEKNHGELDAGFERAQAAVEAAKEERESLRTAGAGRRGRRDLLEERLEAHNQEASRVRRQITYTEEQLEIWSGEGDVLERRLRELELAMQRAEEDLQVSLERRTEAQEGVLEQQEKLDQRRDELRRLEEEVQETRQAREELRSEIEGRRVQRAGLSQDAEHLCASYREAFKLALPGTLKPEEPEAEDEDEESEPAEEAAAVNEDGETVGEDDEDGADDEDGDSDDETSEDAAAEVLVEDDVEIPQIDPATLADLEGELARCKAILERLGPVNVLAAQEYDEQIERQAFLTTQRQDVADSVRSLKATIAEINSTSSERFKETFAVVNKTFGVMFSRLFRGGEAEMRLLDEDDLLESGIEIVARPPGKRAQNLMLLSGGEKALTAIALLFALFQTKPSPFCILDEVDAPLDDVNVLRFVETLQEMAQETQFLIVTHNKLTMEVAGTLYGVTMEEKGISKLVSVELDDVHADIEPVPQAATA